LLACTIPEPTMPDRRAVLALAPLAAGLLPFAARAQAPADPRLAERSTGRVDAPVTVLEFFSLTCGHCASFHRDTWPRVRRELVEAGRMRMVWRDFPLDGVALAAAQVARALPAEQYEGFLTALFDTQDRWAFARNADPREELFRMAALAGMSRPQFDAAIADQALARGILEGRVQAQQQYNVNSTPTFVFGSRPVPGNLAFERFAQLVAEAR
jgi:protein-disulfide isomerase